MPRAILWSFGSALLGVTLTFGLWMWLEGPTLAELARDPLGVVETLGPRSWIFALIAPLFGFVGLLIGLEQGERRSGGPRRF